MNGFFSALFDPAMPFVRNALLAGILSSILFGILGSIVTVRRISALAGAISHAVLGGIGMALFFSASGIFPFLTPLSGAGIFAVFAAVIIGIVARKASQRVDTVINAIWAIGMSIGVLFMAKTPGYIDPMSYLFGNILIISENELLFLAILDVFVVALVWLFYPHIEASSFDEEFAHIRGIHTSRIFFAILIITAVSVVLLQTFVGIVMVIAMLTLPAGTAGYSARSLAAMMVLSWLYATLFSVGGLMAGWAFDLPVGAMVVVIAGAVFLGFAVVRMIRAHHFGRARISTIKEEDTP